MRIVRAGLKAGERVIVEGLQRVRPGATVAPATETAAVSTLSGLTVAAVR
jgi:multidrug efflux system membrane fusion protein